MLLTAPSYFRGGFLRSTFNEVKTGLWVAFKLRLATSINAGELRKEDFRINESDLSVTYIPTGNSIVSKGFRKTNLNQAANLKGLEGLTHVIIDEAEDVAEEDFDKLDDSLRTTAVKNIKILLLFNPPHKNHWLIKKHYHLIESEYKGWYRAIQKNIPTLLSIHSTWHNNSKNVNASSKAKMIARGNPDSPEYNPDYHYRNGLGLISEGRKGRIYTHAKPIPLSVYQQLPYTRFYGLDWGFNDPNAVVEMMYNAGRLFLRQLVYEGNLENEELMIKMRQRGVKPTSKVFYDCARPDNAKTFKKGIEYGPNAMKGFHMIPSRKGPDSIKYGIRELQDVEIYYTDDSPDIEKEFEEYHWALDANKEPTDEPEDECNHAMDAIRYAYIGEVRNKTAAMAGNVTGDSELSRKLDWVTEQTVGQVAKAWDEDSEITDEDLEEFYK